MRSLATGVALRLLPYALLLGACAKTPEGGAAPATAISGKAAGSCPSRVPLSGLPPGTRPEHMQLEYWLHRFEPAQLDAPLLGERDIQAYDALVGRAGDPILSQRDLLEPVDRAVFQRELDERLDYMRTRLSSGRYLQRSGSSLPTAALASFNARLPELQPELRVALDVIPIRCGPYADGLYEQKPNEPAPALNYDRNACSSARPQEVVQVLARWPDSSLLVRTRFALGWIDASAPLSPPIPDGLKLAFVRGARMRAPKQLELTDSSSAQPYRVAKHTTVPTLPDGRVSVANETGFHALPAQGLEPTRRPLTRRALFTTGFQFLDSPYGFGDADGGRDCSRFQMDLFESFDIALPRHSGWQAQAGVASLDVGAMSAADKVRAIEQAAAEGAVLLALPGHIMLYLGRDAAGVPMALHALGEYPVPCPDGRGETVVDVQRTVVSDLKLGAGSARGSLIDRINMIAVFGRDLPEGLELLGRRRALPPQTLPAACRDSVETRIFHSPARPGIGKPLRFVATTQTASAASSLFVYNPRGELEALPQHRLGGPPDARWVRIEAPVRGRYTAVLADGERVLACTRVAVQADPGPAVDGDDPMIWTPRGDWARDTLGLWSAFVEQLFDGPPEDEQTWTNLHTLLRDPARNLLLDHLGLGEDAALEIQPDCADLPFSLRAYFAWKLGLPFGYRQCTRGRPGSPPTCGPMITSLQPRESDTGAPRGALAAFSAFLNRGVRWGVHSGTGRTHPEDPETDLYPVGLARGSLTPGTVYADPYGHVLMVAKWFPQGTASDAYGILLGAEAQPDGTIGRRRFFPGSFLFDPSTRDSGAGFKQFRPLSYDPKTEAIEVLSNAELTKSPLFARFSLQQYTGTKDDFYDRVDRLINPAPLDPRVRLTSLVDALEESAKRRVLAVDNGEQYFARGGRGPIPMPQGYEIFETQGAWEDFATPSRDMRLLIAIDTVLALPRQVERAPERFKLSAAEAPEAVRALGAELDRQLGARSITYTRSDGTPQTLTLQQVRERAERFEVAYNPNDCVEQRWGAPEGSEERAPCRRAAPSDQRARMERYRSWFHERTRPPRGQGN